MFLKNPNNLAHVVSVIWRETLYAAGPQPEASLKTLEIGSPVLVLGSDSYSQLFQNTPRFIAR